MLFYSKPTQYAIRALAYVAQHDRESPCRGETIAREENIPKYFLSKVLQQLVQANILHSVKGPKGGFSLAKDPAAINLFQVVNVFENLENKLNTCAIGRTHCNNEKPCPLHQPHEHVRETVKSYLQAINLTVFLETTEATLLFKNEEKGEGV
ncbi:MAG: Rrf2 family transcriptional regulator [Desulfobulbaceae bacterium]|nr:Rrf2 family transcriptional regulator [Desulfobulbaceae bacterium]